MPFGGRNGAGAKQTFAGGVAGHSFEFLNWLDLDEISDVSSVSDWYQLYVRANIVWCDTPQVELSGIPQYAVSDKSVKRDIIRVAKYFARRKERIKNWKVEAETYDGKKWVCYPFKEFEKIPVTVDLFMYQDE